MPKKYICGSNRQKYFYFLLYNLDPNYIYYKFKKMQHEIYICTHVAQKHTPRPVRKVTETITEQMNIEN